MSNIPPEFPFDERSFREADDLTNALRKRHFEELEKRSSDILSPNLEFMLDDHGQSRLTDPLKEVSREIPMVDILSDVQDFGVLAAYGRMTDGNMTVLHIGENKLLVPVLPQVGLLENYQRIGWPFIPSSFGWFRRKFFQSSFNENALEEVPVEVAQENFFSGFVSFLGSRIGGARWWKSKGSGGGGGSGSVGGTTSAQIWKIHTLASGLSLAYHGTHAARLPIALPGGFTTPVDVYLPMGTLYLGANAGENGKFIFDYNVVLVVPATNPHPIHKTKVF